MVILKAIFLVQFFFHIQGNLIDIFKSTEIKKSAINPDYGLATDSQSCRRTCIQGTPPMTCQYTFEVEYYFTMGKACYDCPHNIDDCYRPDCIPAEGTKRGVVSVNRKIPGPTIEVCLGDRIVVDVVNKLTSESTTMHWHGQHQKDSAYVDGVPYVSQCPTLPHDTFRYDFNASQPGTHWYHSHIGMQRADGDFGALIIRVPDEENALIKSYDYDLSSHIISIQDWDDSLSLERYLGHIHSNGSNKPKSMLINGLGRNKEFQQDDKTFYIPTARFFVDQGYRYRFRILNAGVMNCPIELSIDSHTLTVISTDGNDIVPQEAKSIVIYSGERFDIVIKTDQQEGLYWIRAKGLQDCGENYSKVFQVAVLHYNESKATVKDYPEEVVDFDSAHQDGTQINGINMGGKSNATSINIPDLHSIQEWDDTLKETPDFKYYISFDFDEVDSSDFHKTPNYGYNDVTDEQLRQRTPRLNHITMKMPNFPLLPQRDQIPDGLFCNKENMADQNCTTQECLCYHGIKVPLNAVVELFFIDEASSSVGNHPMHLHGYTFRVVGIEKLGDSITPEEVQRRDELGLIERNLVNAPLKDTVTVPAGGYTIIRFQASNPGFWILHCHLELHAEMGMAMILQVGENEDMLPVPNNFPTCGDYASEDSTPTSAAGGSSYITYLNACILFSLQLIYYRTAFDITY